MPDLRGGLGLLKNVGGGISRYTGIDGDRNFRNVHLYKNGLS
jgi:hypothetical protein